jgi:hypothetical protein
MANTRLIDIQEKLKIIPKKEGHFYTDPSGNVIHLDEKTQADVDTGVSILLEEDCIVPPFEKDDTVNTKRYITASQGETFPIIYAVQKDSLDLVKSLLDHGADPSLLDDKGNNAFYYVFGTTFCSYNLEEIRKEFFRSISTSHDSTTSSRTITSEDDEKKKRSNDPLISLSSVPSKPSTQPAPSVRNQPEEKKETEASTARILVSTDQLQVGKLLLSQFIDSSTQGKLTKDTIVQAYEKLKKHQETLEKEDERSRPVPEEPSSDLCPCSCTCNFSGKQVCLFITAVGSGVFCAIILWHASAPAAVCILGFLGTVIVVGMTLSLLARCYNRCGLFSPNSGHEEKFAEIPQRSAITPAHP